MTDSLLPSFEETNEQRDFRQNYMIAINKVYKYDESIGIMDIGEEKKVSLQDIYVPLKFLENDIDDTDDADDIPSKELKSIVDIFKKNRFILISGKPGSGKTTLSRSIINALSASNLKVMAKEFGRRLPIYIKLRDYKLNQINTFTDFFDEISITISNILKIEVSKKILEFYLKKGWCFLIFDGVDEVGSKENRLKVRNYILKYFNRFNNDNYILITSRPTGIENSKFNSFTDDEVKDIFEKKERISVEKAYRGFESNNNDTLEEENYFVEKDNKEDFNNDGTFEEEYYFAEKDNKEKLNNHEISLFNFPKLYYVTPFNDAQIQDYSTKWFRLRDENPTVITEKVDDFISSIKKIKNLAILRRRPVFLSMMIHIHTTKGKLPYSRAMAYKYMVDAYIEHIDIARRLNKIYNIDWSLEDKEKILEEIAYRLHSSSIKNGDNSSNIQISLSKKEFKQTIKVIIDDNLENWQTIKNGDENALLEFYISRTGLLHEPEENRIQFSGWVGTVNGAGAE
eukprot:TRINITY_DN165397_c0_g1_i6.p1 TRINITY_DN165397_c0_g1~~TRINITY_DN165397_c0_g1_i6.p1  ORF type:complete len:513 (-),score=72.62 TRINITY_DN165397_c0_g1_i6:16-1554(-)